MKVLLINPSRVYPPGSKGVRLGLPLGLMYIAGVLEKNSVPVKIFDSLISPETKIIEKDGYTYHGVSDDYLRDIIRDEEPDIIGITSPFTAQIKNTIKTANLIREVNPTIFIVVGGPHFAVLGRQFLEENNSVDAAVIGEGEVVMLELVKAIDNKKPFDDIKGLIFRSYVPDKQAEIKVNFPESIKELDSLPFPAYHLIDMDCYFNYLKQGLSARPNKHERAISLITSRGCPFNCVFCSVHLHMGKLWRAHSVDYIVSHIQHVINNCGVEHISFEDDNFTFNSKRCENIVDGILEKKIHFSWDTPNGVRADTLNENLLMKMKQSGCQELIVATESGDQAILDSVINKNLRLESIIKVAGWCKKLKIKLKSFFVIGFPGETKVNIQKTIDFAYWLYKEFDVIPNLNIATPLLGTRLHKIVVDNGYLSQELTPENLAVATQARGMGMIKTSEFNPRDLKGFSTQLSTRIARLNLIRKLLHPSEYIKILKLLLTRPLNIAYRLRKLRL